MKPIEFKVRVTGIDKDKYNKKTPVVKKPHVSINMKNGKVTTTYSTDQKKAFDVFRAIRRTNVPILDKINNISLEIKKEYIACVNGGNEHFDVETIRYLDEKVFNYIENYIAHIINNDYSESGLVIKRCIENSTHLFDYQDSFDYDRMNGMIDCLVEAFK